MTSTTPSTTDTDPEVTQFIDQFNVYLEDLQDADEVLDTPDDVTPTTSRYSYSTQAAEAHVLPLKIPPELWQILKKRCPYRTITRFILQATQEKLQREE